MRKGRSQRKTRASLPPSSTRPRAPLSDRGAGPQVVLGLTLGRSDEKEQPSQGSPQDFDLLERAPAPAPAPALATDVAALPTPDEMSIPPMGDLAVEPVAERFFSEGELAASTDPDDEDWDQVRANAARKSLPEVVQRRARFAKYVRWAVGGAAVVCFAALARTSVMPAATKASASHAFAASAAIEATPAAKAATSVVNVEPVNPVAVAPVVVTPEPNAAVATSDKTALQEKNDARAALERGKAGDAIAAGERSVTLDPTDGEAWLLLGAAYQEKGKNADARRAFTSCVKKATRGPKGECRAMLR